MTSSRPLIEACDRLSTALEAGIDLDRNDVRTILASVRSRLLPSAAKKKGRRADTGLLPKERTELCASLRAAGLPGSWTCNKKGTHDVGHLFVSGEMGHSIRVYRRRVLYLVHREGLTGEYDLGTFTGPGWIGRLVDAILCVFDSLSPPSGGWGRGEHARDTSTGQAFLVRLVTDSRGPGRHWPNLNAVTLYDEQSRGHSAANCQHIGDNSP